MPKVGDLQGTTLDIVSTTGKTILRGTTEITGTLQTPDAQSFAVTHLNIIMDDVSTAGSAFAVAPVAGTISRIQSVIDGALGTANAGITTEINGVAVTGGAITITQSGSAAGDVDVATPTAANTVAVGDVIEIITNGASTNTVRVNFTVTITLS